MKVDARHAQFKVSSGGALVGGASVPGDKSLSHRAVMLGSIAAGRSQIRNWLAAGDTEATLGAMRDLGARIERHDANTLTIDGGGLRHSDRPLNLLNAGTGIRLLAGIMVGQPFPSVLDGSEQLRRRPMRRRWACSAWPCLRSSRPAWSMSWCAPPSAKASWRAR